MLDRLMKLKRKTLEIVYQGIIKFTANDTKEVGVTGFLKISLILQWTLQELRKSHTKKRLQKKVYFKRKMMIHATRAERFEKNIEEKRRKEMNLVLEKERLSGQGN